MDSHLRAKLPRALRRVPAAEDFGERVQEPLEELRIAHVFDQYSKDGGGGLMPDPSRQLALCLECDLENNNHLYRTVLVQRVAWDEKPELVFPGVEYKDQCDNMAFAFNMAARRYNSWGWSRFIVAKMRVDGCVLSYWHQ